MKHLYQQNNAEEILSGEIKVLQKLDGSAFGTKKENDKLYYFSREGKNLSREKLITLEMYNEIIHFIENNIEMENGEFFVGELFSNIINPIIEVEKRPKNNFVYFKTNMNTDYLNQFFDSVPVMFSGTLNDAQIEKLIDLSSNKMSNSEWTENICNVLNFNQNNLLINTDNLEGVVIVTSNDEMYKIVDPGFTDKIMNKKTDNKEIVDKKELYNKMTEVVLNQFYSQFTPTNNPDENIENFLTEFVEFLLGMNLDEVDNVDYMKLNYNMFKNYKGIDLTDIYNKAKGTMIESYLWFLFNMIYTKRKRATKFFSNSDIEKINNIRKYFGLRLSQTERITKIKKALAKRIINNIIN